MMRHNNIQERIHMHLIFKREYTCIRYPRECTHAFNIFLRENTHAFEKLSAVEDVTCIVFKTRIHVGI